ncbi:hypothetical protein RFI_24855, partial [Reticulomyxa filosa]
MYMCGKKKKKKTQQKFEKDLSKGEGELNPDLKMLNQGMRNLTEKNKSILEQVEELNLRMTILSQRNNDSMIFLKKIQQLVDENKSAKTSEEKSVAIDNNPMDEEKRKSNDDVQKDHTRSVVSDQRNSNEQIIAHSSSRVSDDSMPTPHLTQRDRGITVDVGTPLVQRESSVVLGSDDDEREADAQNGGNHSGDGNNEHNHSKNGHANKNKKKDKQKQKQKQKQSQKQQMQDHYNNSKEEVKHAEVDFIDMTTPLSNRHSSTISSSSPSSSSLPPSSIVPKNASSSKKMSFSRAVDKLRPHHDMWKRLKKKIFSHQNKKTTKSKSAKVSAVENTFTDN